MSHQIRLLIIFDDELISIVFNFREREAARELRKQRAALSLKLSGEDPHDLAARMITEVCFFSSGFTIFQYKPFVNYIYTNTNLQLLREHSFVQIYKSISAIYNYFLARLYLVGCETTA